MFVVDVYLYLYLTLLCYGLLSVGAFLSAEIVLNVQ